jgi:hypothetical protein
MDKKTSSGRFEVSGVDDGSQWGEPVRSLYSEKVLAQIEASLRPFVSHQAEAEFPEQIRRWAEGYLSWGNSDAKHARSNAPKHLTRLHQDALSLAETIRHHGEVLAEHLAAAHKPSWIRGRLLEMPDVAGMLGRLTSIRASCLELAPLARAALPAGPAKRGRKRHSARRIAVEALAQIFIETTGRFPTRSFNAITGQHYGKFRDFCVAALQPIEGKQVTTGLDPLITVTLRRRMSKNPKASR